MNRLFILFFLVCLLTSCAITPKKEVTVTLFQDCPWEQVTGEMMWFRLEYFDGDKVHTVYLNEGTRSVKVRVALDASAIFALYPLGTLSPYGGFWNPGDGETVYLYPEYGSFAGMLLDAAEARPLAVAEVNMEAVLLRYPDLNVLDKSKVLLAIYDGTLDKLEEPYAKLYKVPLDGILKGRWVSQLSLSDSFTIDTISIDHTLRLFPGVWYYLNVERHLMLTVVLTEDGEYSTRLTEQPKWY